MMNPITPPDPKQLLRDLEHRYAFKCKESLEWRAAYNVEYVSHQQTQEKLLIAYTMCAIFFASAVAAIIALYRTQC